MFLWILEIQTQFPHTCVASVLPAEPSPQPPPMNFLKIFTSSMNQSIFKNIIKLYHSAITHLMVKWHLKYTLLFKTRARQVTAAAME